MHTKVLLVLIIAILGGFFYLHTENPTELTYVFTKDYTYTFPATYFLFAAFIVGVAVAVVNALVAEAHRAIKDIKFRRARKLAEQAEFNYHKGIDALAAADTTAARKFLERAVKDRPDDTGAVINLADTYTREGRHAEALKILEDGAAKNRKSVGLYIAIARSAELSNGPGIKTALQEILKLDPGNIFALRRLRDYHIREGAWEEAVVLQKTITDNAPNAETKKKAARLLNGFRFEAAAGYFEDGKEAEAETLLKEIFKSDETFLPAHVLKGDVALARGNASDAIKLWERALDRFPYSEPLLLRLEDAYVKESKPDRIIEIYKRGIMSHTDNLNLRLLLARLYLRLEMVDNAIEELEGVEQMGEDGFYGQILLGTAYTRREQDEKAVSLFSKALGLDGDRPPPFVCSECGRHTTPWTSRCPYCSQWNSLSMKGNLSYSKDFS